MIWSWFLALKRESKIIATISLLALVIILIFASKSAYYKYKYFKEQEAKVEVLEKEKEELIKSYDSLFDYTVELELKKQKVVIRYKEVEKELKETQNEKSNIPGNVRLFSERVLDSTIRNHKHPKRN